jgi:hypothetical protein
VFLCFVTCNTVLLAGPLVWLKSVVTLCAGRLLCTLLLVNVCACPRGPVHFLWFDLFFGFLVVADSFAHWGSACIYSERVQCADEGVGVHPCTCSRPLYRVRYVNE